MQFYSHLGYIFGTSFNLLSTVEFSFAFKHLWYLIFYRRLLPDCKAEKNHGGPSEESSQEGRLWWCHKYVYVCGTSARNSTKQKLIVSSYFYFSFNYLDELSNILIIYPSSNLIHVSFISDKNNFLKVCNLSLQVSMIVLISILRHHNLLLTHVTCSSGKSEPQRLIFFSRESDSTFTIVHYSVCNQNPSTAWNCHHSSLILPSFCDF